MKLALAVVALCLALCAPASAAIPRAWFGMNTEDVFAGDAAYRDTALADQRGVGVGTIRQVFHWNQIETSPGVYDFSFYDAYVAKTAQYGMAVVPLLFDPPTWASSAPATGAEKGVYPPKDPAAMGDFAAGLAPPSGPPRTLWAPHPAIPHGP